MSKHTPNTCEPSHPHGSPEHVDELNFGQGGHPAGTSSEHHTDSGWLSWGQQAKENASYGKSDDLGGTGGSGK